MGTSGTGRRVAGGPLCVSSKRILARRALISVKRELLQPNPLSKTQKCPTLRQRREYSLLCFEYGAVVIGY